MDASIGNLLVSIVMALLVAIGAFAGFMKAGGKQEQRLRDLSEDLSQLRMDAKHYVHKDDLNSAIDGLKELMQVRTEALMEQMRTRARR